MFRAVALASSSNETPFPTAPIENELSIYTAIYFLPVLASAFFEGMKG